MPPPPSPLPLALALLLAALSPLPAAPFAFSGEAAVVVPPANASVAMQLALRDVQRDLYKVTGFAVSVLPGGVVPARGSLPPNCRATGPLAGS